jgi:antitoxin component of MazEF toxin-antitoxin module
MKLPEWVMTELSWYEDTEIVIAVEGDEIILSEKTDDD